MPIFKRIFKKYDRLNDSVEENVSGIRVVKSFVREEYEKQKFNRASGELCHDFVHVERILAWMTPLMTVSIDVIYLFVVYFGSMTIVSSRACSPWASVRCPRAHHVRLLHAHEPHDALDGLRDGHDGRGGRTPHLRGADGEERHHEPEDP